MILGKSDAELMKEDMAVAVDEAQSEDARVNALDHLEMLIEQIDNANSAPRKNCHLWAPLQTLLTSAPTPSIKMHVLWNNPAAQDAIRAKAIYALSGLLKHNAPAVEALSAPRGAGLGTVGGGGGRPRPNRPPQSLFLLSTLIIPSSPAPSSLLLLLLSLLINQPPLPSDPIHPNSHAPPSPPPPAPPPPPLALPALAAHGLLDTVVAALVQARPCGADVDFEETGVRPAAHVRGRVRGGVHHKHKRRGWGRGWGMNCGGRGGERERWGLSQGEAEALVGRVEA
ncbi:hypothetical protein B0H14DRAFT_3719896 [Mycena olivaceomarginata]|nr:hypothetical protein B0H14DRAFT_3719896 [Mycena olivaceomarginata]